MFERSIDPFYYIEHGVFGLFLLIAIITNLIRRLRIKQRLVHRESVGDVARIFDLCAWVQIFCLLCISPDPRAVYGLIPVVILPFEIAIYSTVSLIAITYHWFINLHVLGMNVPSNSTFGTSIKFHMRVTQILSPLCVLLFFTAGITRAIMLALAHSNLIDAVYSMLVATIALGYALYTIVVAVKLNNALQAAHPSVFGLNTKQNLFPLSPYVPRTPVTPGVRVLPKAGVIELTSPHSQHQHQHQHQQQPSLVNSNGTLDKSQKFKRLSQSLSRFVMAALLVICLYCSYYGYNAYLALNHLNDPLDLPDPQHYQPLGNFGPY